jgi:nitroreductase
MEGRIDAYRRLRVVEDAASMMSRNPVFGALGTSRAVRRFKPDPVARETVEALIWAATRAASPENDQPWEFVVVTDPATRAEVGRLVAAAADMHAASLPPSDDPGVQRSQESAKHLVRNFAETPVMIFVCHHVIDYPEAYLQAGVGFSGVFMAAADLLVAARSLGLGAAFTFTHMLAGPALPKLLELPDDVVITVTIPVGWPWGEVGPVARRPHGEVLHWNKFGS